VSIDHAIRRACAASLVAACATSNAYEVSTHRVLSELAVQASQTYKDPSLLTKLGFPGRDVAAYRSTNIPSTGLRSFIGVVSDGAEWEDNQYQLVVCNHFFDPQANNRQGIGLVDPVFFTTGLCRGPGVESPLWSVEDRGLSSDGAAPTGYHEFSMRRAYAALRQSLIGFSSAERSTAKRCP